MDPRLKEIIDSSNNIVFFGGAGVSTESNIPDFRSESGLYHAQQKYGRSPEEADYSIRISLSHQNTKEDIDTFIEALATGLAKLSRVK